MSGRILSKRAEADLSVEELDVEFSFDHSCRLVTVYVHSNIDLTEEIQIVFKSGYGAEYNTVIADRVLDTESDYVYTASGIVALNERDILNVTCTNANGVGSVYVTAKVETDYHG